MLENIVHTIPEAALRQSAVRRERAALLLIDMQCYFEEIAGPIIGRLKRVLDACRQAHLPIFYTQHGYEDPALDSGMLGQWWGDPIIVGDPTWPIISELAARDDDRIVRKKRYNAFYGTDLEMILRSHGIRDVIIGGVMTNLCCETTAREAFVRDFRVFFLADGTATISEEYHMATLKNLAYGFAYLKQCDELIGELGGHPE